VEGGTATTRGRCGGEISKCQSVICHFIGVLFVDLRVLIEKQEHRSFPCNDSGRKFEVKPPKHSYLLFGMI
jgi:hypothetical protein